MVKKWAGLGLFIVAEVMFAIYACIPPQLERGALAVGLFGIVCGALLTYLMKNLRASGAILMIGALGSALSKLRIVKNFPNIHLNTLFLLITTVDIILGLYLLLSERTLIEKTRD